MKINGLKIHRKISWLVASFSSVMFIIVSIRKFFEESSFYQTIHLAVEWSLMILLVSHCILSQKYLKLWIIRIIKGLKSKRSRPIYILRLIQLLTNRIIIILAALVVLSGFGYYDWYTSAIGTIMPFDLHLYYDFFFLIFIIMHVGVGFKFMFIRKKMNHWSSTLFIVTLASILLIINIILNTHI